MRDQRSARAHPGGSRRGLTARVPPANHNDIEGYHAALYASTPRPTRFPSVRPVSRETFRITYRRDIFAEDLPGSRVAEEPDDKPFALLADTKIAEDHVKDILDVHTPRQAP